MSQLRLVLIGSLLAAIAPAARAQNIQRDLAMVTGSVNAMAIRGRTLYLGGNFTSIGPTTGAFAIVDTVDGSYRGGPQVLGYVTSIVSDGSGGWYLGGTFSAVGGMPRANLAHVLADGSVSPWNPGTNGDVRSIALDGTVLYVGGAYSTAGGAARANLAAIDVASGAATSWNPAPNSQVNVVSPHGGVVYAGGFFTQIGGQPRNRVAALSPATGSATGWNPDANNTIRAMAFRDTVIYLGGDFATVGGQPRGRFAIVGAVGGAPTAWAPSFTHTDFHFEPFVSAITVSDSRLYVGGFFNRVDGVTRVGAADFDAGTGALGAWNPGVNTGMTQILASGPKLYLAGNLNYLVGSEARNGPAAVDVATGVIPAWDPKPSNYCWTLAESGGRIAMGGGFQSVNFKTRYNLAAINLDTGQPTDWNPGTNDVVYALAAGDSVIFAGGQFSEIGGQTRYNLAALDPVTGVPTAWDPAVNGNGGGAYLLALATSGPTVYVGGIFTSIGGQNRNFIAALNGAGSATPWDPSPDGPVWSLAATPTAVYAGGEFTQIGSATRNHLAAISPATGAATAWNPSVTGSNVNAIVPHGNVVYVGGSFTQIGSSNRNGLAAIRVSNGNATTWNPGATNADPATVNAIAVDRTRVIAAGAFSNLGGGASANVAAIDSTSGSALSWNPGVPDYCQSLALDKSRVYVGGVFMSVGLWPRRGIAGIYEPGVVGVDPLPIAEPGLALSVAPNPSGGILRLDFVVPETAPVKLRIYDVQGRIVESLVDGWVEAGPHHVEWTGMSRRAPVSAGLYFVQLEVAGRKVSRRVVRM